MNGITRQKTHIKEIFQKLLDAYNGLSQGKLTAFYMLSAAFEAGQAIRIEFLKHLSAPSHRSKKIMAMPNLTDITKLLADRLNYRSAERSPFPNACVMSMLDLDGIPKHIRSTSNRLLLLINAVYDHTKTFKQTGIILGISADVVSKILKNNNISPIMINKFKSRLDGDIKAEFPKIPEQVLLKFEDDRCD